MSAAAVRAATSSGTPRRSTLRSSAARRVRVGAQRAAASGYGVVTDRGTWRARHVVVATGPHGTPRAPARGAPRTSQVPATAAATATPAQLPPGGVLVVGASSSGRADRRRARPLPAATSCSRWGGTPGCRAATAGMDIFWWLESTGRAGPDHRRGARPRGRPREPSLQLVGRPRRRPRGDDLDLAVLQRRGVPARRPPGALSGRHGRGSPTTWPTPSRRPTGGCTASSTPSTRYVDRAGLAARGAGRPTGPDRFTLPAAPTGWTWRAEGIGTVVLAAGYRPDHPWLRLPDHRAGRRASGSTAASPPRPVSTSSASGSSTAATPASSTAPATTPTPWSHHLLTGSLPGARRPAVGSATASSRGAAA